MKLTVLAGIGMIALLVAAGSSVALIEISEIATDAAQSAMNSAWGLAGGVVEDVDGKASAVAAVAGNVTSNAAGQANAAVALAGLLADGGWDVARGHAYLYYAAVDGAADSVVTCAFGLEPTQSGVLGFQACVVMASNALVAL